MRRVYSRAMLDGVVGWPPELAHRYRARGYWAGATLGQAGGPAGGGPARPGRGGGGPAPPPAPEHARIRRRLPRLPQGRRDPGPLPARRGDRGPGEAHG